MTDYLGITIDVERDNRLSDQAVKLMEDYYMLDQEQSPQEAFARASVAYCSGDLDFAQRIVVLHEFNCLVTEAIISFMVNCDS